MNPELMNIPLSGDLSEADLLAGRLAGTLDWVNDIQIRQGLLAREMAALCGENLSGFLSACTESPMLGSAIPPAIRTLYKIAIEIDDYPASAQQIANVHAWLHGDTSSDRRAVHLFSAVADLLQEENPFLIRAGLMLFRMTLLEAELPGARRTGQMLVCAFSVSGGIVPWPGLGLSAFLNATSADHLKLCKAAEKTGNPEKWLVYFLNGVARQCEDLISRITRLEELLRKWKQTAEGRSNKMAAKLISRLAGNPFLTAKGAAADLHSAFTTAQRAVDKLLEAGIVQETTHQQRDRIYCAGEILAILEEPPRVMGVSPWREEEILPEPLIQEEPEVAHSRHDPAAKLPDIY